MKLFAIVCLFIGMLGFNPVMAASCGGGDHTHDAKAEDAAIAAPATEEASTNATEAAEAPAAEKAE